jgi:hypothetical protein
MWTLIAESIKAKHPEFKRNFTSLKKFIANHKKAVLDSRVQAKSVSPVEVDTAAIAACSGTGGDKIDDLEQQNDCYNDTLDTLLKKKLGVQYINYDLILEYIHLTDASTRSAMDISKDKKKKESLTKKRKFRELQEQQEIADAKSDKRMQNMTESMNAMMSQAAQMMKAMTADAAGHRSNYQVGNQIGNHNTFNMGNDVKDMGIPDTQLIEDEDFFESLVKEVAAAKPRYNISPGWYLTVMFERFAVDNLHHAQTLCVQGFPIDQFPDDDDTTPNGYHVSRFTELVIKKGIRNLKKGAEAAGPSN